MKKGIAKRHRMDTFTLVGLHVDDGEVVVETYKAADADEALETIHTDYPAPTFLVCAVFRGDHFSLADDAINRYLPIQEALTWQEEMGGVAARLDASSFLDPERERLQEWLNAHPKEAEDTASEKGDPKDGQTRKVAQGRTQKEGKSDDGQSQQGGRESHPVAVAGWD